MYWLKREMWKAGLAIAGILLALVLMVWLPVTAVGAYEGLSRLATPRTVQATPTVDMTVTALSKEQLTLQVKQLQNQNNWVVNNSTALIAAVAAVVVALFGILQWAITARQAQNKDQEDRDEERQKEKLAQEKDLKAQAEERFKTAVTALGDGKEGAQVGGAILLRSFLNKDDKEIYGRYYTQIFDLAVAYLRLTIAAHPPENPDGPSSIPEQSDTPQLLTPLSQTLIVLFKETFPLARDQKKEENQVLNTTNVQLVAGEDENFQFPETTMVRPGKHYDDFQSLDASVVQLDNAYLRKADLEQVWMPDSFLRKVDLWWADLRGANFNGSNLSEARLVSADLSGAYLSGANLSGAYLSGAKLIEATLVFATLDRADLSGANLSGANLNQVTLSKADLGGANLSRSQFIQDNLGGANLSGANLSGANFNMANLSGANLKGADLSPVGTLRGANLSYTDLSGVQFNKVTKLRGAHLKGADLTRSNFGEVLSMEGADFGDSGIKPLEGTDLREVKGLTKKQLITCKAKGAIIDEDLTTSASLSPVSPSPPSQSKEVQAPSASTVQASQPTPDAGRSSNASSFQLGSEP